MADITKYINPKQGYDWSIEDKGEGKVLLATSFPAMQIGALKGALKSLITRLDKFANEESVPGDLDGRGRKRA